MRRPLSAGLFNKAIIQSGAYGVSSQLTQAELEKKSIAIAEKAILTASNMPGCTVDAVTAACLRGLSDALVRNQLATAFAANINNPVPSVDGKVLPATIKDTFVAGAQQQGPRHQRVERGRVRAVLRDVRTRRPHQGLAAQSRSRRQALPDEGRGLSDDGQRAGRRRWPRRLRIATQRRRTTRSPTTAPTQTCRRALRPLRLQPTPRFSCNGLNVSSRIKSQGSPIWMYEFRDQTAIPLVGIIDGKYPLSLNQGAAHAAEIPYVFNMHDMQNAERTALQTTMSQYWVNFARTGNPNGNGVPKWGDFSTGTVQGLDVASGGGVAPMATSAFAAQHKCDGVWKVLTF